jgi:hypothetical protein
MEVIEYLPLLSLPALYLIVGRFLKRIDEPGVRGIVEGIAAELDRRGEGRDADVTLK